LFFIHNRYEFKPIGMRHHPHVNILHDPALPALPD